MQVYNNSDQLIAQGTFLDLGHSLRGHEGSVRLVAGFSTCFLGLERSDSPREIASNLKVTLSRQPLPQLPQGEFWVHVMGPDRYTALAVKQEGSKVTLPSGEIHEVSRGRFLGPWTILFAENNFSGGVL